MFTTKAYFIRVYASEYRPFDLGVDALILEKLCYVIMYLVYIYGLGNQFVLSEFLWGCFISIMYMITKQNQVIAYSEGPGGPVNAMIVTQSLYQLILDVTIEHQSIGPWGLSGVIVGFLAALIIAVGNFVINKCSERTR